MSTRRVGPLWRSGAAFVGCAVAVAVALAGCTANGQPEPTVAAGASAAVSTNGPSATVPLETSQTSTKAPVYWLGRARDGVYLYREFRDTSGTDNPVTKALRLMMSAKPLDTNLFTPWQPPKKLAASISGRNVITVDVSSDAFNSTVDEQTAQLAVQQLVYTATAAAASAGVIDTGQPVQVMLLVDGRTDQLAFNRVQLGRLMQRDPAMVASMWIIDPQGGTESPHGQIAVFGRVTMPGAEVFWQIARADVKGDKSSPYVSGHVSSSRTDATQGQFRFNVNLPAGKYVLRLFPNDPGAGDPTVLAWDSKEFTITP
ncbi:GerMN domain-containing protein [Sinomonas sp. ASV322]|uniref:GerMN domain-containing protein n=1 Tax=Sinomonas sp. ASV322 TaxID=3041920 RepID=UPI0027DD22F6|nr:GerMN domain-containing protein [Sinomonas sp. ASV322]MDQ4501102.1 GerMN domain-containing protein [Sinomonas sp. ASV322]